MIKFLRLQPIKILPFFLFFGCSPNKRIEFPYSHQNSIRITHNDNLSEENALAFDLEDGEVTGQVFVMTAVDPQSARLTQETQIAGLKSVFDPMVAPYGGQLTRSIVCEAKKFLKESSLLFQGKDSPILFAVANERKTTGTCSIKQIRFVTLFWVAYDVPQKNLLQFKLYRSIKDLKKIDTYRNELKNTLQKIFK